VLRWERPIAKIYYPKTVVSHLKNILIGVGFAMLWASASTATKFGIQVADPLIIANVRFMIAGLLMLAFVYATSKNATPRGQEWKYLGIFALLNTTIYLGAFVLSMREVAAGIGSLSTATGPLFVIVISALWQKRSLRWFEIVGVMLGISGAALATWPLIQGQVATPKGLLILMTGIVSVSAASVYYSSVSWRLSTLSVNGWQVFIGGILLAPFTLFFADWSGTQWNAQFWLSVGWLIIPVSVISLQLWFYLLRQDAVSASFWLFLCPIFGFTYAHLLLNEPLSWHTFVGTLLVILGLYVGQKEKFSINKTARQQR
jgi:probable blue pigment (indigoidine) exporter